MKTIIITKGKLPSFEVEVGETIVWKNEDTVAHQINSDLSNNSFRFDIGIIFPGEISSPVTFDIQSDSKGFLYGCGLVPNLSGKIHVGIPIQSPPHNHTQSHGHDHGHDHLKHFHGFVTGGRNGNKIYMSHTPIFLDERHHFQIILRASFTEEKHLKMYNDLRNSSYGAGKIQLFFDHVALIEIQSGAITELVADHLRYYPDVKTERPGLVMPAVPTRVEEFKGARIKIDKILHFRQFEPNMPYPEFMTYLMYGDENDVFIDHFISRAPNFHSVAQLSLKPEFWKEASFDTTLKIAIPSRKIIEVPAKEIKRVAFMDNQIHLMWGIPSGATSAVDPIEREPVKADGTRQFDVLLESGEKSTINISNLLHFDATRLLNDGLGFSID